MRFRLTPLLAMAFAFSSHSAAAQSVRDAPEISRSAGEVGGIVVMWPRIIPRLETETSRELALAIQTHLAGLAAKALPGRAVDIRPEPERVCRRAGCRATTVGAVLVRKAGNCILVGLVSAPGQSAQRQLPWVGKVKLKRPETPFREPPESDLKLVDYAACAAIPTALADADEELIAAMRTASVAGP